MTSKEIIDELEDQWLQLKSQEKEAQRQRRIVEDKISSLLNVQSGYEGTKRLSKLKISWSVNRMVDFATISEILEKSNPDYARFFSLSASLNLKEWRAAPEMVQSIFAEAITAKPTRPTFTQTEEKND